MSKASTAIADEIVGFYFHNWGLSSQGFLYFPHAFVTVVPAAGLLESPQSGVKQDYRRRSFGFTAANPGPGLILGHTRGEVIDSAKFYLAVSQQEFAVRVSEAQYQSLLDAVSAWKAVKGDPYDLRRRNCVTFVAALARSIGLDVGDDNVLDPSRFLADLRQRNIQRITREDSLEGMQVTTVATPK